MIFLGYSTSNCNICQELIKKMAQINERIKNSTNKLRGDGHNFTGIYGISVKSPPKTQISIYYFFDVWLITND